MLFYYLFWMLMGFILHFYTPVLVYKYDLTNKIRMHVAKDYIVGFVFEHSFQLYNFYNMH